jgi:hypothetical protein
MNVEMQQASNIVISARKALFENPEVVFNLGENIAAVHFLFAPRCVLLKPRETHSVYDWFTICLRWGLKDIKFLVPTDTEQKHLLGFANTSQSAIVCFWKRGKVSCFCPVWRYNRKQEGWHVFYSEHPMDKDTFEMPVFSNQSDDFKEILLEIGKFAAEIEFPYFANVFHNAYEALCDPEKIPEDDLP